MATDLHIVMLPWSAFGHLIPFIHLAIALAKAGIRVSFLSTPRNIQRLLKLPLNLEATINFVELPFPLVNDGNHLLEDMEATVDLPSEELLPNFVAVYDLLRHPFKQFITTELPDWIIQDFMPHWAVEVAQEFGLKVICFSALGAAAMAFAGPPEYMTGDEFKRVRPSPESLTFTPNWITFPSSITLRPYEANSYYGAFHEGTICERVAAVLQGCQAFAIRSSSEFEGEYIKVLEKIYRKPVITVGLLPPVQLPSMGRELESEEWCRKLQWLNEQKPKSVVFVGFGSESKLRKVQVDEIAYGLELSNLPFLWALRKPHWATEVADILPDGFNNRIADHGVVYLGWAPQLQILSHPSIGGSLFHAGWGSIIETLQYVDRLVVLPLMNDQGLNAKLLVEKGLAIEVDRNEDGSFHREAIAKSLRQAMVSEGESLSLKAREVKRIIGDQTLDQDYYIGGLVQYLRNGAAKKNLS
ncbi:UDP-glycosyltransferase 91A1-like [Macadamia integrifolia]|uniref:UDP-glycosyltransferase 91A1-like n=1 Tax=Macadamia integrifolia TaxID=60698 RepID=UPI001C4EC2BE|nr:UDP-glycosyltransferase 91A1-like [Macadamia integrifolia]